MVSNIKILMFSAIMLCSTISVANQNYPSKQVNVIIPFSKGSATDIITREMCKGLSKIWGQKVVGKNFPGNGGTVAATIAAKAPPDGYTLFVHSSAYAINPAVNKNLSYDPLTDFTHIVPIVKQPLALVVEPSSGINSLSSLIAFVKSKPGQLNFGSPGTGSAAHLTAEKFKIEVDINIGHIPFNGGPETAEAINAGKVAFSFLPVAFAKKTADLGKLKVLGVTSLQRSSAMPDVPTIAEEGLAGFEYNHWWGLWAPATLPKNIVDRIEKDVMRSLAMPELKKLFAKIGAEPMNMTSAEFLKFVINELESVARTVREARIQSE